LILLPVNDSRIEDKLISQNCERISWVRELFFIVYCPRANICYYFGKLSFCWVQAVGVDGVWSVGRRAGLRQSADYGRRPQQLGMESAIFCHYEHNWI